MFWLCLLCYSYTRTYKDYVLLNGMIEKHQLFQTHSSLYSNPLKTTVFRRFQNIWKSFPFDLEIISF